MTIDYREVAFESAIEHVLLRQGYLKGNPAEFDPYLGLFPARLINFIKDTQPKAWEALETIYGANVENSFLTSLTKAIKTHPKGLIGLLRDSAKGKYKDRGIPIRLFFLKPDNDLNPDAVANYHKNRLTITRQVKYSTKSNESIDVVIDLNGFPIITMELKNHLTGQSYEDAIEQYKDRDPNEPIFLFNQRSLVHFAVDPDEVHMTTELKKEKTYFLPFNKGYEYGKGNPPHPSGYKTSYLWEEILQKDSLFDVLQNFIELKIEKDKKNKKKDKKQLIFPRFHQLDAVRKIVDDVLANGPGKRYLIQHSAGSGKSNTIAWLSYRLASLADAEGNVVFNTVIVITDRVVLDTQIQDTIRQFDSTPGFVAYIDKDSNQLAEALSKGSKIIVTTLQKFPFVIEKIQSMPEDATYAIIMDEAHSSQTGITARKMKDILSYKNLNQAAEADALEESDEPDIDDQIASILSAYKRKQNLSLFAFTATPKKKTLEMFGQINEEGKPEPFHLYSMRQAIEEGFILDVLKNYVTYETYFKICKAINDDPEVEKKTTMKGIARFVSLHPTNLSQKAEIIIEHFRNFTRHKIGGKAKAMVVTSSRLHAKRYMDAFQEYLKKKNYKDLHVLVAFSGKVHDEELDETKTESEMNGFPESQTKSKFEEDEYKILIVADKYQTGFDQPLLHTMYVDKKLSGVKAVQTLSRLNRTHPEKHDTFVLDFVNDRETIRKAFQPYYEKTEIDEPTDPNIVYEYKRLLDDLRIYEENEIDEFCKVFFQPKAKQTVSDQAKLYKILALPEKRFNYLTEDQKDDAKSMMKKFISQYLFLSQLIEYDEEMKRYFTFIRFLYQKINAGKKKNNNNFSNDLVDLEYYRIQKVAEGAIELEKGASEPLTGGKVAGGKTRKPEYTLLSEIVNQINELYGLDLDDEVVSEQLYQVAESFANMPGMKEQVLNNSYNDFRYPFQNQFIDGIIDSFMEQKKELDHENKQLDKLMEFIASSDEGCKMISEVVGKIVYNMIKNSKK